jgi:hypothetical protein
MAVPEYQPVIFLSLLCEKFVGKTNVLPGRGAPATFDFGG